MTYASNEQFLDEFQKYPNFKFIKSDINDLEKLYDCDYVINTAAETHVDNSIVGSDVFLKSNVDNLLEESILSDDLDSLYHLTTDDEAVTTSNTSSHQNIIHYDLFTPITWAVDKSSSSLPSVMTFSEDFIKSCVGFRKIDTMKHHFHTLCPPSIKLDKVG
jgi:hypothetical protein